MTEAACLRSALSLNLAFPDSRTHVLQHLSRHPALRRACGRLFLPVRHLYLSPTSRWLLPDLVFIPRASLVAQGIHLQCRRHRRRGFNTWVRKIPWRRKWPPAPVFLPGESHGQRRLMGYSPWGRKQSDMTQHSTAEEGRRGQREDSEEGHPTHSQTSVIFPAPVAFGNPH